MPDMQGGSAAHLDLDKRKTNDLFHTTAEREVTRQRDWIFFMILHDAREKKKSPPAGILILL